MSARALRAELGARNLQRAATLPHEVTYGSVPSVVYDAGTQGGHGNFLPASFRRIQADAAWSRRLEKTYTASARLPRSGDRWRGELECAGSSDALLMNVFCYPGVLRRRSVLDHLGLPAGCRPAFGVRAGLPMRRQEVDRTEWDMVLGDLVVEAKLTEGGFGVATASRLQRYPGLDEIFALEELPQVNGRFAGYQLLRGMLAAVLGGGRYAVLLDARRADLVEICYSIMRSVRAADARSRFRLLTWQELGTTLPATPRRFLAEKYGIEAPSPTHRSR